VTASPWEKALGDDIERLHPRLRDYFGAIPDGSMGYGEGVFDVVGTPRAWLWPILMILSFDSVVFPVWEHGVPFRVRNSPGPGRVDSLRRFEFDGRSRTMVDSTSATAHGIVDRLGRRGIIAARFDARVRDRMLVLESSATLVLGIPLPRAIAPRVVLTERWDDSTDRQRVSLVVEAPLIGRLYEYSGSFTYRIAEVA
jgi:hypothetical protein